MPGIFISYRREDSGGYAGRLFDILCERFGRQRIFMDLDGIHGGENFATVIEERIGTSDVVLAVIGERWLTIAGPDGGRRLDAPGDWVRLEIAKALERGERVIPVLVDEATMPKEADLPEELRALAARQAMDLRNAHFREDAERLIAVLDGVVPRWKRRSWRPALIAAVALAVVIAGVGGAMWMRAKRSPTGAANPIAVGSSGSGAGSEAAGSNAPGAEERPAVPSTIPGTIPSTEPSAADARTDTPKRPAWRGGRFEGIVTYDWQNAVYNEAFDLQADDGEIGGTASFVGVARGIESGTISGDRIRFVTKTATRTPEGTTIQDVHTYKGTVRGDVIQFSMLTVSESDSHVPVLFTAKRVKK